MGKGKLQVALPTGAGRGALDAIFDKVAELEGPVMKYLYYPGCSLEAQRRRVRPLQPRPVLTAMGADITELEDWNCCGASAAEAQSRLLALALPARNLAIAEKMGNCPRPSGGLAAPAI